MPKAQGHWPGASEKRGSVPFAIRVWTKLLIVFCLLTPPLALGGEEEERKTNYFHFDPKSSCLTEAGHPERSLQLTFNPRRRIRVGALSSWNLKCKETS